MYKDLVTSPKIRGLYALLNSKKEFLSNYALKSIINILSEKHRHILNKETIVTDQEIGLINSIHKYFPNS